MKCPDALEFAIENAIAKELQYQEMNEYENLACSKRKEVDNVVKKYFRYDEVLTVIIDTENQTCIVEEV
jgi:hypothetical protein